MNNNSQQKKVLVLKGGVSSEKLVSLESARCVERALEKLGYAFISFDLADGLKALMDVIDSEKPDVVFNALHGGWGENGSIQAFLNMLQIPYTHSGVLASALAMNKNETKKIAETLGVDVPKGMLVIGKQIKEMQQVDFDCVIKPNQEGSSVGVCLLQKGDLIPAELKLVEDDKTFLIEEYIPGQEFSVAVTDDGALGIIEIVPKDGFYDYKHKYVNGLTDHVIRRDLLPEISEKLLNGAFEMHHRLGCKGVSRSDFRYDPNTGRVVFLELNANPGMTDLSLVPELALEQGISYQALVDMLITKAGFEK